ncbi:MAG: hypothetical protein ABFD14_12090 [Anaerolineaceae bacterium]
MLKTYLRLSIALGLMLALSCCVQNNEATPAITTTNSPEATRERTSIQSIPTATYTFTATIIQNTEIPLSTVVEICKKEKDEGIDTGKKVVIALENYLKDKGVYPQSLNELIPTYLPSMLYAPSGQEFEYHLYSREESERHTDQYRLAFTPNCGIDTSCGYYEKDKFWYCLEVNQYGKVNTLTPFLNETHPNLNKMVFLDH